MCEYGCLEAPSCDEECVLPPVTLPPSILGTNIFPVTVFFLGAENYGIGIPLLRLRDTIDTVEFLLRRENGFEGGEMTFFIKGDGIGKALEGNTELRDIGRYDDGKGEFVFNGGNLFVDFVVSVKIVDNSITRYIPEPGVASFPLSVSTKCDDLKEFLYGEFNLQTVSSSYDIFLNVNNPDGESCSGGQRLLDVGIRGNGNELFFRFFIPLGPIDDLPIPR